jgi:hypothetical protein
MRTCACTEWHNSDELQIGWQNGYLLINIRLVGTVSV